MRLSIDLPEETVFDLVEFSETAKIVWSGMPSRHNPSSLVAEIVQHNLRTELSQGFRKYTLSTKGQGKLVKIPALSRMKYESAGAFYSRCLEVAQAAEALIKKLCGSEASKKYHDQLADRLEDWKIVLEVDVPQPEPSLNNRKEVSHE